MVTEEDIEEERKSGMLEEYIQQEFYCSFSSSLAGAYFAKEMQKANSKSIRSPKSNCKKNIRDSRQFIEV